jgi:hypothetical protein
MGEDKVIELKRFLTCTVYLFVISCSSQNDKSAELQVLPTSFAYNDCAAYGDGFYIFNGLNTGLANRALEGDIEASRKIVTQLLAQGGEDGAISGIESCRLIFWTEISAQNGSIYSAYELATFDGVKDVYLCRRSKHWAKVVLSRANEFRNGYLSDADPKFIERSIAGRSEQMRESLKKDCAPLGPVDQAEPAKPNAGN